MKIFQAETDRDVLTIALQTPYEEAQEQALWADKVLDDALGLPLTVEKVSVLNDISVSAQAVMTWIREHLPQPRHSYKSARQEHNVAFQVLVAHFEGQLGFPLSQETEDLLRGRCDNSSSFLVDEPFTVPTAES